ncbi:hypothetical protein CP973_38930 [Streptomyces albofaciens JCM 4342]|uniref:hypothetical protein n=1 Tax=Streptomyces albofaciens TaxID=66866 RepID=UPI00123C0FA3|nr:hypothetical protein [Streptomyces albofaciens]KAA6214985.1 hypothetical protein CP973_38930 [Streptomyces albofaciens JCM 4342]
MQFDIHPGDTWQGARALDFYLMALAPTPRNLISATVAFARIDELGWAARSGYPGSDVQWPVQCMVCGWQGERFYSHLRRAKPLKRHQKCAPVSDHARALSALNSYATSTCPCHIPHPTREEDVARLIEIADDAWRESDTRRLLAALKHLLGPCPATAQRAAAAKAYATTAQK